MTNEATFRRIQVAAIVFVLIIVPGFIAFRLHEGLSVQRAVAVHEVKLEALERHLARTIEELRRARETALKACSENAEK